MNPNTGKFLTVCASCQITRSSRVSKEKKKEYDRVYLKNNREKFNQHAANWRKNNKEKSRVIQIKCRYSLTQKEINRFEEDCRKQKGKCKICGEQRRLDFDHDHETEEYRGAICNGCNKMIGFAHDCPSILRAAATYLKEEN